MRRGLALVLLLVSVPACDTGGGSRVEPFLPRLPATFVAGVVQDAGGRAVVGAVVRLQGAAGSAVSARNGRFFFSNPPAGTRVVTVDPTAATATGADRLGSLVVLASIGGGAAELDRPLVLPDQAAGTSKTLPLGAQTSATKIDGSAASGAVLDIQAGTVLTLTGRATGQVSVNLARVGREDLPRELPPDAAGARLPTRGIWVAPLGLRFTAGARLSLPNDLGLPANGKAALFRLDPGQGTWTPAGTGTVQSGRIVMDGVDLAGGGLYVFTTTIAQTVFLAGRVVDASGNPIGGARVTAAGGLARRADGGGSFSIGPLPARDGANQPLTLPVAVVPPLGWEPIRFAGPLPAAAGDIVIDSFRSGLVRFVLARRGRAEPLRRVTFGGRFGIGATRLSGTDGLGAFREIAAGWVGAFATWVVGDRMFRGVSRDEMLAGNVGIDLQVLARDEAAVTGELEGRLIANVLDESFAAPLEAAFLQGRNDPGTSDKGRSDERGELLLTAGRFSDPTAVLETKAQGKTVRSACTIARLDNSRAEFPLRVARRARAGAFDEHAVVTGTFLGAGAGAKVRKALVRPRYRENDFWNRVLTGRSFAGDLPRKTDPDTTGGTAFALGLPVVQASLTALEGRVEGGAFVPEKLGLLADVTTGSGQQIGRDLTLAQGWDHAVTLEGILAGLDPALPPTLLRYHCGARRADGTALDLLTEAGGVQVAGKDATLPVPGRTGPLADSTWLIAVGASGTKSGATVSQTVFVATSEARVQPGPFLALPEITSPAPGSTTASAETVPVTWKEPAGTDFLELDLESTAGAETRAWKVFLPSGLSTFTFKKLVPEAPQILAPARTWTLALTAHHVDRGVAFGARDGYQRLAGNLFSIRPGARGIQARSTWKITFSTP